MQLSEHLLTVVAPNEAGEVSLDIATDVVARGGTATVVVLLDAQAHDDLGRFADSEDLDLHHGRALALDRLAGRYASRVGRDDTETIIFDSAGSARNLLDIATESRATSIVIPQQLIGRRKLRKLVSDAHVPVLVAPAA